MWKEAKAKLVTKKGHKIKINVFTSLSYLLL